MIFDSSVYIASLREGDDSIFAERRVDVEGQPQLVYLSAVVLQELNAGAVDKTVNKLLANLERGFQNSDRLLVPNLSDWSNTGRILSQIGQTHGFERVKRSRLTNDCLIATSASRLGLTIATLNVQDFQLISEFRPTKLIEV